MIQHTKERTPREKFRSLFSKMLLKMNCESEIYTAQSVHIWISVRMRENTDQNNFEYRHFSRSVNPQINIINAFFSEIRHFFQFSKNGLNSKNKDVAEKLNTFCKFLLNEIKH